MENQVINAEYIVIGDICFGKYDRIPAHSIILQSSNAMVDESLLTGESVGVNKSSKDKENNSHMGTILLTGKATAKLYKLV